jgi:hypothetical protein
MLGFKKKHYQNYTFAMKALGVPFVIQCAWRSFFPEIYNIRVTFWDSPLCSPFIGRMLATIGEVTWMA